MSDGSGGNDFHSGTDEGLVGGGGGSGDGLPNEDNVDVHDELWQRIDREQWTEELCNAHSAFTQGKTWKRSSEWAACVQRFYNFEGAWGFVNGKVRMGAKYRPHQVGGWIGRGRKWMLPPALPSELGEREAANTWIGGWWKWWQSLQPKERGAEIESEELMRPASADWSQMARMYSKNGLLQVMATLSWWGAAAKRREEDSEAWSVAVKDVTWVLEQILNSGEIRR
jgi:hypothetical protein